VTFGFGISLFAKYLQKVLLSREVVIQPWEYVTIAIGLAISLVLFAISRFIITDKKRLLQRLKSHFDKSKPIITSYRGSDG